MTRQARVRALAKINVDLRVIERRPDGYHELRTIFQTISLADRLDISFTPGRQTAIELDDSAAIPDNLVARAARLVMDVPGPKGRVEMRLTKRIPMGAGLGGGSSDAAAILIALPVLTGRTLAIDKLFAMGQQLGSDIPFFLLGGRAAGIGRGTELFPLPDETTRPGILVSPAVHVSTADAYRRLATRLTTDSIQNKIFSFQSQLWQTGEVSPQNDFEEPVFEQHRDLATLKQRLKQAGASTAMMTGSGSALYGLFRNGEEISRALKQFPGERVFRISLINRARYHAMWWRSLAEHMNGRVWPPRSRYAR